MKNKILILVFLAFSFSLKVRSDEGMWLPFLINENYAEMKKLGLNMTVEEMYSHTKASLKDAIVLLDGGSCTGEIISSEGLLLTNHHCGFRNIQKHSSPDHDYLTDGFWAMKKEEELMNPGKTASFLIRMENVTNKVLSEVTNQTSEVDRKELIKKAISSIVNAATTDNHYDAIVESMFNDNEYYLFVYEIFRDVRLVGAPPSSIGKFGGNTDNWMWPRHTGDFSLFRVYCGPDGKPADPSVDNIPMKPKHFLPVSLKGYEEKDFAMIWGFPGSTNRYLTSSGVESQLDQKHPNVVKILGKVLEIMETEMNSSDEIRIKYATKHARSANSWKYYLGQEKGLKKLDIVKKKQQAEKDYQKWADKSEVSTYSGILPSLDSIYKSFNESNLEKVNLYYRMLLRYAEILSLGNKAKPLLKLIRKKEISDPKVKNEIDNFRKIVEKHFKDYDAALDKKIFIAIIDMIIKELPETYQPDIFKKILSDYKSIDKFADQLYENSILASKDKLDNFLNEPNKETILKDSAAAFIRSVGQVVKRVAKERSKYTDQLAINKRIYMDGYMQLKNRELYPDANSTMRCTYGTVGSYEADGKKLPMQTYLSGIIEKEDPKNKEFTVEKKLKELYKKKNYGRYGINDKMPVAFLTNNDITGGNSGSPVLNANGELIGTAFDGNWEAMSSDITFEPDLQRTIICDIRYVLFVIDKFAGASHLVEEMKIIE